MSQEDRFLEARQAREAERLQQQNDRKARHEKLNQFWTSLRSDMQRWEHRLVALKEDKSTSTIQTASQRTLCIQQWDLLLQDLYALKRSCLSSTSNLPELPPADVRLLHQEFTSMATKLDQVQQELIPPTKFTFKRYRAAMQEQQQKLRESDLTVNDEPPTTTVFASSIPNSLLASLGGNVIQDYSDAMLNLDASGKLTIQTTEGGTQVVEQSDGKESSSLLLQNLRHCQVNIDGTFKALHIQNVSHSSVRVVNAIGGALHVTACHELDLYATSHQLRMHDSSVLKLHVQVGSGPILEDCSGVVFYVVSSNHDFVYETKDFNWLRNGIPSPNFCIVQEKEGMVLPKVDDEAKVQAPCSRNDGETDAAGADKKVSGEPLRVRNTVSIEVESDDDDEL